MLWDVFMDRESDVWRDIYQVETGKKWTSRNAEMEWNRNTSKLLGTFGNLAVLFKIPKRKKPKLPSVANLTQLALPTLVNTAASTHPPNFALSDDHLLWFFQNYLSKWHQAQTKQSMTYFMLSQTILEVWDWRNGLMVQKHCWVLWNTRSPNNLWSKSLSVFLNSCILSCNIIPRFPARFPN